MKPIETEEEIILPTDEFDETEEGSEYEEYNEEEDCKEFGGVDAHETKVNNSLMSNIFWSIAVFIIVFIIFYISFVIYNA